MTGKILVSACLLGQAVRYDGAGKTLVHSAIESWRHAGLLVPMCPEMSAGMPAPRPPAEIADGATGEDVLRGSARVVEITGRDVTHLFLQAAENAVRLARETGCRYALLIDGSPSCGSLTIHDGTFSGTTHTGIGVTAALLRRADVEVYSDGEIDRLLERLAADRGA